MGFSHKKCFLNVTHKGAGQRHQLIYCFISMQTAPSLIALILFVNRFFQQALLLERFFLIFPVHAMFETVMFTFKIFDIQTAIFQYSLP